MYTNSNSSGHLGAEVDKEASAVLLRQYSSGGSYVIEIQQRARPDAYVAMHIFHGGTLCVYAVSHTCTRGYEYQGR